LLFFLSLFGVFLLVLRRLPEAVELDKQEMQNPSSVTEKLSQKGLPAESFSRLKGFFQFWLKKIWQFMLEAKDLKPAAGTGYRIRKIIKNSFPKPAAAPLLFSEEADKTDGLAEEKTEADFLEAIKQEPKNLANYDALGKYYLDKDNFSDALDVYRYLCGHDASQSGYHSKLAYAALQLKDFTLSVAHYEKSLALDSTHPNRYYNLGLAYKGLGKFREALENFKKALDAEPGKEKYLQAVEKTQRMLELDSMR
jgi:tetratricopeptide (TPR) repeat protein